MNKKELIEELTKIRDLKGDYNAYPLDSKRRFNAVGNFEGLSSALELIDQLDEPEITEEQAWEVIERTNHYHIAPADVWKYKEAIQKGILPSDISKPELPVIPKFVADWIIEYKEIYDTREIIYQLDSTLVNLDVDMWIERNFEKFYRAWLLGYTIEPPKTLQVIIKNYDSTVYTTEIPEDEAMKLVEGWKGNE